MANMSYCRFENTYRDLMDCFRAFQNGKQDDLSDSELNYAIRLVNLCEDMIHYKDELDDIKQIREEEEEEDRISE